MKKGIAEKRKAEALQALVIQMERIEHKLDAVLGSKNAKAGAAEPKPAGTGKKGSTKAVATDAPEVKPETPADPPVTDAPVAGSPEQKPE